MIDELLVICLEEIVWNIEEKKREVCKTMDEYGLDYKKEFCKRIDDVTEEGRSQVASLKVRPHFFHFHFHLQYMHLHYDIYQ